MGLYFDAASDCYYEADIDRYVGIFTEGEKDTEQMIRQYQDFIEALPHRLHRGCAPRGRPGGHGPGHS